ARGGAASSGARGAFVRSGADVGSVREIDTITGARSGGQNTPTSLVVPRSPEPVLSPTRQPAGRPARRRVSPVLLPTSQRSSCARATAESAFSSASARRVATLAPGGG